MTKTLITIAILTLITLAGVFWFTQNKEKKEIVSTDKVVKEIKKETQKEKENQEIPETSKEESQTSKITYNPDGSIDTSDWKTYTNKEYGFSLKYPGEWDVDSSYIYTGNSKAISFINKNYKKSNDLEVFPEISIEYGNNRLDKEYAKFKNLQVFIDKNIDISYIKKVDFLDYEAYYVKLIGNYNVLGIIFIHKEKVFIILIHPMKNNLLNKVDKTVIKTLTFIN